MTDLRKEQLHLLRFEKQVAGLAALLAASASAAHAADGKLHATEGAEAYASIQSALVRLAEATAAAHDALSVKAVSAGATLFQAAGGGLPKQRPDEAVLSILGLG